MTRRGGGGEVVETKLWSEEMRAGLEVERMVGGIAPVPVSSSLTPLTTSGGFLSGHWTALDGATWPEKGTRSMYLYINIALGALTRNLAVLGLERLPAPVIVLLVPPGNN